MKTKNIETRPHTMVEILAMMAGNTSPAEKAIRLYRAQAADESLSTAVRKRAWKKVVEEVARLVQLPV